MDGAFDVDCPRTPDGGDDSGAKGGSHAHPPPSSRPPARSAFPSAAGASSRPRGPRGTSRTPRTTGSSRKAPLFSPKGARKKPASVGLEPEEYIAPAIPLRPPGPPAEPPGIEVGSLLSVNPLGSPPSSRAAARARAHSTDAFGGAGTNPFDDANDGGISGVGGNRARSSSGSWWREEIVDEGEDKGEAMDQYYGLNARQKYELYGGPPPPPPQSSNAAGGANPFDAEQGGQGQQRPISNGNLDSDIYQQAAAGHSAGYYNTSSNPIITQSNAVIDDYSFSNVNLSSPVETHPVSPLATNVKTANIRDGLAQKWLGLFSRPKKDSGHLPPHVNIAPRSAHGHNGGEWHARSPGVTFDCFHPTTHNKRRGYWANLSPGKKIAVGVVWVAFVCIIFGVTISELRKANAHPSDGGGEGASDQVQGIDVMLAPPAPDADPTGVPTPWPATDDPTASPTKHPTPRPTDAPATAAPVTQGNIGGYQSIHGKAYDATPHPTRSPTTDPPSGSPTTSAPTKGPTGAPTVDVQMVQFAPSCEDAAGTFANHLDNPKDCVWLGNGKDGYTDRKDKNCGGRPVMDPSTGQTVVYPATALGNACQATCGLYNGCGAASGSPLPQDAEDKGVATSRNGGRDKQGWFINHLGNPKTCAWLYNDKAGRTDRKDKNCGTVAYPATELGTMCAETCAPYNSGARVGQIAVLGGQVVRSYASAGYSYSVSHPSSSTGCIDGEGEYVDHKRTPQPCSWLAGDGHEYNAAHRQEKNCGSAAHEMTDLGKECPWSCRAYNDCGS